MLTLPVRISEETRASIVGRDWDQSRRFIQVSDGVISFIKARMGRTGHEDKGTCFLYDKMLCREHHEDFRNTARCKAKVLLFTMEGSDDFIRGRYVVSSETSQHFVLVPCDDQTFALPSSPLSYPGERDGFKFRSVLECKFYTFLSSLGVRCGYESLTVRCDMEGVRKHYTVDFTTSDLSVGGVRQFLCIELKPTFPTQEEIALCEAVSLQGVPIVLVYGDIVPPRKDRAGALFERPHRNGLRAMTWSEGECTGTDLVFAEEEDGSFGLRAVTSSKDARWCTKRLMNAYAMAKE